MLVITVIPVIPAYLHQPPPDSLVLNKLQAVFPTALGVHTMVHIDIPRASGYLSAHASKRCNLADSSIHRIRKNI